MSRLAIASVLVMVALIAPSAEAQWLKYPTPGIPRTVDGKPDLSAPPPRGSDGKPDLSGVWRGGGKYQSDLRHSDVQRWAQEQARRHAAAFYSDRWAVLCLPPGPMINFSGPLTIIQTPDRLAMLYEVPNNYRQIFTDGRELPRDPNPTWQGYSVGRWDGDTLVADTIGFNDRSMIGRPLYPHSEDLRISERYRRRDFGHIDLHITVNDPKSFLRPWTIDAELVLEADAEMLETVCNENEKDRQHFVLAANTDAAEVPLSPSVLAKYVGTYAMILPGGGERGMTVTLEGDQLMGSSTDGERALFIPQSTTTFIGLRGSLMEFISNQQGEVTHVLVDGELKVPRVAREK
jgi:hypothetical protein